MRTLLFLAGAVIILLGLGGFAGIIATVTYRDASGAVTGNYLCINAGVNEHFFLPLPEPLVQKWKATGFSYITIGPIQKEEPNPFH